MSDDNIKKIRYVGDSLQKKADDFQNIVQAGPNIIRKLRGIGDFYSYVANEYERLQDSGIVVNVPQSAFKEVDLETRT